MAKQEIDKATIKDGLSNSHSLIPEELLVSLCQDLLPWIAFDVIGLYSPISGHRKIKGWLYIPELSHDTSGRFLPLHHNLGLHIKTVLEQSQSYQCPDIPLPAELPRNGQYQLEAALYAEGMLSMEVLPLYNDNHLSGALIIGRRKKGPLPKESISLLSHRISQLGRLLPWVTRNEQKPVHHEALIPLSDVTNLFCSGESSEEALRNVIHKIRLQLDFDAVVLNLIQPDGMSYRSLVQSGHTEEFVRSMKHLQMAFSPVVLEKLENSNQAVIVGDLLVTGKVNTYILDLIGFKSGIAVPVKVNDELCGVLICYHNTYPHHYPEDVLLQLTELISVLSMGLQIYLKDMKSRSLESYNRAMERILRGCTEYTSSADRYTTFVEAILDNLGSKYGMLIQWINDQSLFVSQLDRGMNESMRLMAMSPRFIHHSHSLVRHFQDTNQPVLLKKKEDTKWIQEVWFDIAEVDMVCLIPLYQNHQFWGLFHVGFSEEDVNDLFFNDIVKQAESLCGAGTLLLDPKTTSNTCQSQPGDISFDSLPDTHTLQDFFKYFYQHIHSLISSDVFYGVTPVNNTDKLQQHYGIKDSVELPDCVITPSSEGALLSVIKTHQMVYVSHTQSLSESVFRSGEAHEEMVEHLYVPLVAGDSLMAIVVMESRTPDAFTSGQIDLLKCFTDMAAQALCHASEHTRLELASHRLSLITRISSVIAVDVEVESYLNHVLSLVRDSFNADACIVRELDGDSLKLLAWDGVDSNRLIPSLPVDKGCAGEIILHNRSLAISDAQSHPLTRDSWNNPSFGYPFRSYVGVPMVLRGQIYGIMAIYTSEKIRHFNLDDIQFLQSIANYSALTIENTRLFREKERFTQKLEALVAITEASLKNSALDSQLSEVLGRMKAVTHADAASLLLFNSDKKTLEIKSTIGYPDVVSNIEFNTDSSLAGKVFKNNAVIAVESTEADPTFVPTPLPGIPDIKSTLGVPLRGRSGVIGVVHLDFFKNRVISSWEISLLEILGSRAGLVIENSSLYRDTRDRAESLYLLQESLSRELAILDQNSLEQVIAKVATSLTAADMAILAFFNNGDKYPHIRACHGMEPKAASLIIGNQLVLPPTTLAHLHNRVSIKSESFEQISQSWGDITWANHAISALMIPLVYEGKLMGVLGTFRSQSKFRSIELQTLELFTQQACMNLHNARLFEMIRNAEENYRTLFEQSNDSMFLLDLSRQFTFVNAATEELTGYSASELSRKRLDDLILPLMDNNEVPSEADPSHLLDLLLYPAPQEYAFARKDGKKIHVEISSRLIRKDSQVQGIQCIARDISDRKRKEHQIIQILNMTRNSKLSQPDAGIYQNSLGYIEQIISPKPWSFIQLWLQSPDHDSLVLHSSISSTLHPPSLESLEAVKKIAGEVVRTGRSRLINRIFSLDENPGVLTDCLCVPLTTGEQNQTGSDTDKKILGVLLVADNQNTSAEFYDEQDLQVFELAGTHVAMAIERSRLYEQMRSQYLQVIKSLAKVVDLRDSDTLDHSNKTSEYASRLAHKMELSAEDIEKIEIAALLHDIGKIGIPDAILRKPDRLTDIEYEIIKRHPELGAEILKPLQHMEEISSMVLHHQEHYDGTGYPAGLKGEGISVGSRILAIVDAYHAMTSDRTYRRAMPREKALAELRSHAGRYFDPEIVEHFLAIVAHDPD